jgi:hypothetical protein
MEIKVDVKDVQKSVTLEVGESHRVGQVVDEIIQSLNLPRNRSYELLHSQKAFGSDSHHLSMSDLGVKSGDRLWLVSKALTQEKPVVKVNVVKPTDAMLARSCSNSSPT